MASLLYLILSVIGLSISRNDEPQTHGETITLKCACNICEENNTCITDGICFTEPIRKDGKVSYEYGCLNKSQLLPPDDIPFVCRDGLMCCLYDYCNRRLQPDDALMGGCMEAVCVKFCEENNLKGVCREAYPGGEKLCLCEK